MKIRIPHLVQRAAANGGTRYYWQPSATLKAAGWQPQVLGRDLDAAMRAAAQWNERVEEWRAGAAAPTATGRRRQVQKYARRETLRELIADYRADRFEHLGAQTCRTYQSALNILDAWAGDQPVAHVTADRCKVLLKALATPSARGAPERLHRAAGVGRVLRTLMQWAEDAGRVEKNPMARVTIREPKARHHVWPDHCIEQFVAMADAMGLPAIGTATMLAADTGQREADLLKLTWGKLSMVGGRRSIRLRQAKTAVWVEVPFTHRVAARLDALEAANRQRPIPATTILTRGVNGQAFPQEYFIRQFAAVRAAAIAGSAEHGLEPCPELEGLQYRDLRRTLIVRLAEAEVDLPGIAAISGHQIEACKKILETYMPRTGRMAAAAIEKLEAHRAGRRPAQPGLTAATQSS